MKQKAFLISGAVLTVLSACTSEEIVEPKAQAGNEIKFATTVQTPSRAEYISAPNGLGFGEFVLSAKVSTNGSMYFHDIIYSKAGDANVWTIKGSDPYYWNSDGLDFFAHVNAEPYDNTVKGCEWNSGKPTISFKVNPDVTKQKDLLVAYKGGVKANTDHNLNFRHALSQVVFKAVNSTSTIDIEIDGITIKNVADNGTFSYFVGDNAVSTDNVEGSSSLLPAAVWASRGNANASFSCLFESKPINKTVKIKDQDGNDTDRLKPTNLTDPAEDLGSQYAFMMIPQGLYCNTTKDQGFHFLVSCKIKQSGQYLWGNAEKGANVLITPVIPADPVTTAAMTWEPGKKYVIVFNFDDKAGYDPDKPNNPALNAINFTVSVDEYEWDEYEITSGLPIN